MKLVLGSSTLLTDSFGASWGKKPHGLNGVTTLGFMRLPVIYRWAGSQCLLTAVDTCCLCIHGQQRHRVNLFSLWLTDTQSSTPRYQNIKKSKGRGKNEFNARIQKAQSGLWVAKGIFMCISSHLIKNSAERNQNLLLGFKKRASSITYSE